MRPPKSPSMPAFSAAMPVAASTEPLVTFSCAPATSVPRASARYCHAGMPCSVSCSISSDMTLPLACICPMARVQASMPSWPEPSAAVASPMAVSVGMTSSAAKPYASSFWVASVRPLISNGVFLAKSVRSAIICLARSGPSIVESAMSACSAALAVASAHWAAFTPAAVNGAVTAAESPAPHPTMDEETRESAEDVDAERPDTASLNFAGSPRISITTLPSATSYPLEPRLRGLAQLIVRWR